MAIALVDNISIQGMLPDVTRQQYATLADLRAVRDARMPERYVGWCLQDHKLYFYNKNNVMDPNTGKWRPFVEGMVAQVTQMPIASEVYSGICLQYVGESTEDYEHGYFYECAHTDSSYFWFSVTPVKSISNREVDALFEN